MDSSVRAATGAAAAAAAAVATSRLLLLLLTLTGTTTDASAAAALKVSGTTSKPLPLPLLLLAPVGGAYDRPGDREGMGGQSQRVAAQGILSVLVLPIAQMTLMGVAASVVSVRAHMLAAFKSTVYRHLAQPHTHN
jgi:hypothetical protein